MNLWILCHGDTCLPGDFTSVLDRVASCYTTLADRRTFEFRQGRVHYISAYTSEERTTKRYHHETDQGGVFCYCGLPLDPDSGLDLARAEYLPRVFEDMHRRAEGIYAALRISAQGFTCLGDPLGAQKVFVYRPDEGTVYLSNDINLLKPLKRRAVNLDYFVQTAAMGHGVGDITEDRDILRLPMYARAEADGTGFRIQSTRPVHDITEGTGDWRRTVAELATAYRRVGRYLYDNYPVTMGLSGGYDSRLTLLMFAGADLSRPGFNCFTNNTGVGLRDVRIARRLAAMYGTRHRPVIMNTGQAPDLEGFAQRSEQGMAPCRSFDRVWHETIAMGAGDLFVPQLTVYPWGEDGGVLTLTRLSQAPGDGDLVNKILKHYADWDMLTPMGRERLLEVAGDHLRRQYADVDTSRTEAMFFLFERDRNGPVELLHRTRDLFAPFYFTRFLELVFQCDHAARTRTADGSYYHMLARELTAGKVPNLEFAVYEKWDAGALEKRWLVFKKKISARTRGTVKFELQLKTAFFMRNIDEIRRMVADHGDSGLFAYFDREKVEKALETRDEIVRHCGLLCRLIPSLPCVDG